MNYTNIVLAIPHSVGLLHDDGATACREVLALRDRFTDWFTDELFSVDEPCVSVVRCPVSRLEVDVERLEGEEDRLCNYAVVSGAAARVLPSKWNRSLAAWFRYRADIMEASCNGDRPMIIDCHSYPRGIGDDTDVCLGFNEDSSRPDDQTIGAVSDLFQSMGYAVGINVPYSNAIAPLDYRGHSLMVEVNKRCYMDEAQHDKGNGFTRLHGVLVDLYHLLLGHATCNLRGDL